MLDWSRQELAEGLRCYRAEEFFAAHEHWEAVWLELGEPEKGFLQGLILVAGAFHHLQRGNVRGAISLLRKAETRFQSCEESFVGIEVSLMRKGIAESLTGLEADGTSCELAFPRIRLLG